MPAPTYYAEPYVPPEQMYPMGGYDYYPEPEEFTPPVVLADDDLKKALVVQIEYYFSDANLAKGKFYYFVDFATFDTAHFGPFWKLIFSPFLKVVFYRPTKNFGSHH